MTPREPDDASARPIQVTETLLADPAIGAVPTDWDADRAVTVLYSTHYRSLVRLAALLLRDVSTAEEVVQDSFVAMLPAQVPLWMTVALIAMVSLNEVWWYSLVALFFGSGPVRGFYLAAKTWIDRVVGLFLGAVGLKLLWAAISE